MAKNLNFYFDNHGVPRARGKHSERLLMSFLETDVQGSEYICHDLMNDLTAVEDETVPSREFLGNAHSAVITPDGVTICSIGEDSDDKPGDASTTASQADQTQDKPAAADGAEVSEETTYVTTLKHFREILEDWEAFILDEEDPLDDSIHV